MTVVTARRVQKTFRRILALFAACAVLQMLDVNAAPAADERGDARLANAASGEKKKGAKVSKPAKRAVADDADETDDEGPPPPPPKFEYELVTLADGTQVTIEKWGETFMAYRPREPVLLDDRRIEELVNYQKLKRGATVGAGCLQIDSEAGKMYWCDGYPGHAIGRISWAKLNGSQVKDIAGSLASPCGLVVDRAKKELFWVEGESQGSREIKTSDLNGKKAKSLVNRLKTANCLALDPVREEIYYAEEHRIIRIKTDGTGEELYLDGPQRTGGYVNVMVFDPVEQKLYWGGGGEQIRRANRDGTGIEEVVNLWGKIPSFAIDGKHRKLYWTNHSYGQLLRGNLDGSQVELLVMSVRQKDKDSPPNAIADLALDLAHTKLYWTGAFYAGIERYATICRMALPTIRRPVEEPAPPLITTISPSRQTSGARISLHGEHFERAMEVRFVDDSTHRQIPAKFEAVDRQTISVTVPKMSDASSHPLIVVRTPSGVTMTLSKSLKTVRSAERWTHDRFRAGKLAQLWLMPESHVGNVEGSVVYAEHDSNFAADGRGETTLFAKSGSRIRLAFLADSVLYHEPFVIFTKIPDADPSLELIAVPAIRPSFPESLFTLIK